jgi:hypothetical protein
MICDLVLIVKPDEYICHPKVDVSLESQCFFRASTFHINMRELRLSYALSPEPIKAA